MINYINYYLFFNKLLITLKIDLLILYYYLIINFFKKIIILKKLKFNFNIYY